MISHGAAHKDHVQIDFHGQLQPIPRQCGAVQSRDGDLHPGRPQRCPNQCGTVRTGQAHSAGPRVDCHHTRKVGFVPGGNGATGRFRDGGTQQLASVTWTSSNPRVAQISNDASSRGVGFAIKEGTVIIIATAGHVRGWALLTVHKSASR
jgi:Bacterial Ig-like domain (group 2)